MQPMQYRGTSTLVVAIMMLLLTRSAGADPIYTLLERDVFVSASHCALDQSSECSVFAVDRSFTTGSFDSLRTVQHAESWSIADQSSLIDSTGVRASGHVSTESGHGSAFAFSTLNVVFNLVNSAEFTLEGTSGQIRYGGMFGDAIFSSVFLRALGDTRTIDIVRVPWEQPFAFHGVLAPGSYQLLMGTASNHDSNRPYSSYDISFALGDMTATPEPGTLMLLATGLGAIVTARRRRKTNEIGV